MNQSFDSWILELSQELNLQEGVEIDYAKLALLIPSETSPEEFDRIIEALLECQSRSLREMESGSEDTNALSRYIFEIRDLPLVSSQEEEELLLRICQGEEELRENLIHAYLPMVLSMARKDGKKRDEIMDLIQEGNIALMKAARTFVVDGRLSFRDYARWMIKKSFFKTRKNLHQQIRFPAEVISFFNEFHRISESVRARCGHAPDLDEIAREMKLSLEEVKNKLLLGSSLLHMNQEFDEKDASFLRYIRGVQKFDSLEVSTFGALKAFIKTRLALLTPLEKEIVEMRYGLGEDSKEHEPLEISRILGLKTNHIHDIEYVAMQKLSVGLEGN